MTSNNTTQLLIGSINIAGDWFRATGCGLTLCTLDEMSGHLSAVAQFPEVENAIWMARTPRHLLVAHERFMEDGEISVYGLEEGQPRTLAFPAQKSSGGAICHLELSADGATLYAVSYLAGVSVHALRADGEILPAHQVISYRGSGPNKERQEKPHPHQATLSPDGKQVLVCDLGSDAVWVHAIEGKRLGEARSLSLPAGSGPRHLVFHPRLPVFYLIGELDAMVRVYASGGKEDWQLVDSLSALPPGFAGVPGGAAIRLHPSGKSLAVSVRGSDTVAVFVIDASGSLSLHSHFSTGGKNPRDVVFSPSGRWLIALNQDSDTVISFAFDPATGLPTGGSGATLSLGSPVCAIFQP
ncbi:MAG: lactonase family protein [Akkermansiaceae bacterium]|nr:lactonase family protein [Akkermansiaceae bacterium]